MRTQTEKAHAFVALHARPGAFIIPNPWDAGTAKLLAAIGFEALATTSLGLANTLGTADVSLDAIIENCRTIAAATDLPVNADLENCGADEPQAAARAIGLAAEAGAVGGSIEDSTGDPQAPIYDFALAVERVLSAAGVKRISVGGAMSRFALAAFLQSAREMKENGSFSFVTGMAPIKDIRDTFAAGGS